MSPKNSRHSIAIWKITRVLNDGLRKRAEALGVGIARGKDDFLYFTLEFARLCEVRRVSRTLESLDNLAEQEDRSSNDDFSRRARDLARAGER